MLYETFGGVGEVSFARLCVDIDTGDSKGFGFVSFKDRDAAERAIKELTGQNIDGRDIQVLPSTPRGLLIVDPFAYVYPSVTCVSYSLSLGKDTSRTKSRRSPPPCFNYQKGSCKFGERCRFSHGEEAPADTEVKKPKAGVCFKFQIGSCKFGEQCKFSHDLIEASKNPVDTSESPNGKVKKAALSKDVQGGKPKGDDASTDKEEPDAERVSTNGSRKRQESVAEKDGRSSKKKRQAEEIPDVESSPEERKQKKKKKKKLLGKATEESAKGSNKKRSRANDEVIGESPEKPKKRARTGDEPKKKKKKKKKATSELKQLSSQGAQADETLSDDVERFAKGKRKKKGEAVISKDKDKSDKKPKKKKKKKVKAKATTLEGNDSTVKSSNPKSKKKSKKKKVSKES